MRGIRSFSVLAAAVSLTMLLGGSMVSNVYAEGDHEGSQKQFMSKEHGKDVKHDRQSRHHKWDMFKGLNLNSAQKEQIKGIMKGHHKEFTEGKIAVLQARQPLMLATPSPAFDQTAVQRAAGDVSAAQEKIAILRAKVFSEVMPILTPDQKAVVSGKLAKTKLRMQKIISKLESKRNSPTE